MNLNRGKVDTKGLLYDYNDALAVCHRTVPSTRNRVSALSREMFKLFFTSFLFEPAATNAKAYLQTYVESALVKFRAATNVGSAISYVVNGASFEWVSEAVDHDVSVLRWISLFYATWLLGDSALLTQVAAIDLPKINAATNMQPENYNFLYAVFLQKWFNKDGDVSNDLVAAATASNAVSKSSLVYDYMLDIGGPQLDLFATILYRDQAKFSSRLQDAVGYHKKFFESESKKGIKDFVGIVSLPLSALCSIAESVGLTVDVTSDFIW